MNPASQEVVREALRAAVSAGIATEVAAEILDVGSKPWIDAVERDVLSGLATAGAGAIRVVCGPYGSGKTHLLDLIRAAAARRGLLTAAAELSRGHGLADLATVVQEALCELRLGGVDGPKGLPAILRALGEAGAKPDLLNERRFPHPSFARGMQLALRPRQLSPDARMLLDRYLEGESVRAADLTRAGLKRIRAPLSRRNAASVLATVAQATSVLGRGIVLLFDESEQTLAGRHAPRLIAEANVLRRLIDAVSAGDLPGVCCVFGVLADFGDRAAMAYPALGQRLDRPRHTRAPLRWPVLDVSEINLHADPDEFARAASEHFTELARAAGARDLKSEHLRKLTKNVLFSQAGASVRRELIRTLAAEVLRNLEVKK